MSGCSKALKLEKLTVSFDGFKALNDLTLHVDAGEMLCIIGPNGAGKTTMMDVITGKTRPSSGAARFGDDIDLLGMSEAEIVAAGIGRKFQKPTVFERLTVFGEPRTRVGRNALVRSRRCVPESAAARAENRSGPWHHRALEPAPLLHWEERWHTVRSNGSRSEWC